MALISLWKERRLEAGFTQEEVAERLGITRGAIGQYELSLSFPGKDVQEAACRLFKCQPDGLYRFEPDVQEVVAA